MLAMFGYVDNGIFQHDNAPPHRSQQAATQLGNLDIETLPWPPNIRDLNPIENMWHLLKRRLRKRRAAPDNLATLRQLIDQEWALLANTPDVWRSLVDSMPARVRAVQESRGVHTKF